MEPSRTALAHAVDALASLGRATVTESAVDLAVYQLDAEGVRQLLPLVAAAGLRLLRLADEGGELPADQIGDGSYGIEILVAKPVVPDWVLPVLTRTAFQRLLERRLDRSVVWLQELDRRIDTWEVRYAPWGDLEGWSPDGPSADPGRVVRMLGRDRCVEPIGRWLLRDPGTDLSGALLAPWRRRSALAVGTALAQEIEWEGRLLFPGPPPTRFVADGAERLDMASLAALQRAAGWVFENPRELGNRHGLLAAEIVRTALRDGDLVDLASVMPGALEGARIAYGFGVSQQSREALKTLSDLRRSVTDETLKLADATRSLATAMTTSAIANVGLIIARLTLPKEATFVGSAAILIGVSLAAYVAIVIGSGWHYLAIQRDLRSDWRDRLYRFLPEAEYERMVSGPVGRAEDGFRNAAIGSGIVTCLLLIAVILVTLFSGRAG